MKNVFRLAVAAAVVLLVTAAMTPAEAACGLPRAFGPSGLDVVVPGGHTPNLNGTFWSFGAAPGGGNPTDGLGNDAGTIQLGWWLDTYYGQLYDYYGYSHWAAPGVDGCIDADGSAPGGDDPDQCMVMLLTDQSNGTGYFALASVPSVSGGYDFSTVAPGGFQLAAAPKPNITGSVRNGSVSVDLTLNVPAPSAGTHLGGSCAASLISGARYRVYTQGVPSDNAAPTDRDLSSGWTLAPSTAAGVPVGQSTSVTATCSGSDTDFYLCSTLLFPAGNGNFYEVANCSQNSTRVECGPSIADPIQRRPNRPGTTLPNRPGRR